MTNTDAKNVTIIINGREKTVPKTELTFDQLVQLAFDEPPTGEFICFTITYRRGQGNKPEGTLSDGETAKIKDGMIFNVTATDKS
ncbi:MAG: multiubiquitin domain-containing protein [Caldilineaceae bacterium]|nr:multiubiquitin domain-containing protein [Caldilineaceae bacterium]